MMFPEQDDGTDHYHSSGIIASLEAGYQWLPGRGVVIEPQAQVIYQGVQQDDFTAANHARVSQSQGMIFRRGWVYTANGVPRLVSHQH